MTKIYYEVEVRIYEIFLENTDGQLGELKSFSDGFIKLENDMFEGYTTNDKLSGDFSGNELWIEFLTGDNKYLSFTYVVDFLKLPGKYVLKSNIDNGYVCEIFFKEKITQATKIEEIESEIKRVDAFHAIP